MDTQQGPNEAATTVIGAPAAAESGSTPRGSTWISDAIVAKIAGIAAREVEGVAGLRTEDGKRGWGSPRPRDTDVAAVTVVEQEATIDLRLVVRDGVVIPTVVAAVRERVIARVQEATGMRVLQVDIGVVDVVAQDQDAAATAEEA